MIKNESTKSPGETGSETSGAHGAHAPAHRGAGAHSHDASETPLPDLENKKKKKKRKYSKGTKQFQKAGRNLARFNRRISRAIASGFAVYYQRNENSSRRKRDGAVRDAAKNWAKGLSKALRKGSDAPNDIARAFDNKRVRRQLVRVARLLTPPYLR